MNRKPSRTFLYLAFVMVFLFVVGLIMVGVLISNQNNYSAGDYFTGTAVSGTNSAIATGAAATQTWIFVRDIATSLRDFEISTAYLQTRDAERQTEVFSINTTLGPTNAAFYWATETAVLTRLAETLTQMSLSITPSPTLTP
ncbi:MAG: hypothetical protein ABI690_03755 [Chloroflexota bacterium]